MPTWVSLGALFFCLSAVGHFRDWWPLLLMETFLVLDIPNFLVKALLQNKVAAMFWSRISKFLAKHALILDFLSAFFRQTICKHLKTIYKHLQASKIHESFLSNHLKSCQTTFLNHAHEHLMVLATKTI